MSAPSSNSPNGQRSTLPTGNPRPKPTANPLRLPRRRPANPLVAPKRTPRPSNPPPGTAGTGTTLGLRTDEEAGAAANLERLRNQYGGWSEPPPKTGFQDIPIVTTAKALREGTRYHVMRFPQLTGSRDQGVVDPTDQNAFTRPVTLHRRDPEQEAAGRKKPRDHEPPSEQEMEDDKETERQEKLKAEREAQKAADQAKIAPTVKEMATKRPRRPKDDQVIQNRMPKTEKGRKQAALRYEEALPWHLEDTDGRNVWLGTYVAALSEANVALVFDGSKYRMIPLEKWYRFTAKPAFTPSAAAAKTPEPGSEEEKKQKKLAGWMTSAIKKREEEILMKNDFRNQGRSIGRARAPANADDVGGFDEIDMEGLEFDDDDEHTGFDHDEDTKISNARIRREQLGANLFGDADEREVEAEEQNKLKRELARKMASKKLKKTLKKRENVNDIESDDSENSDPFVETSSDEDEDEDEDDNESQAKNEEDEKAKTEKDRAASGMAPKGSTTPSGKRQTDMLMKAKNLKRPGSPTHSESSGNESTLRKKVKKKAGSTAGHSRSTTPMPQGPGIPSQAGQRRKAMGASVSDGEATGGEMSDGQPKKKKIKLLSSSSRGTPVGSRAGSPLPVPASASPGTSPTRDGQGTVNLASPKPAIEAWEIVQALPQLPDGISIQNFLKLFEGRVGEKAEAGRMAKSDWIKMVRENCSYGSDKLLRRKT